MGSTALENGIETTEELESTPAGKVKRWVAELDIASKAEETWRKTGSDNWKLYKGEKTSSSSFNILWSNTETLRPALYNSLPEPDVRRRFPDKDPVGRVGAEVLERSLKYSIDTCNTDKAIKDTVLDTLIVGRGVARVKYTPTLRPMDDPDPLGTEEPAEEIEDEYAPTEHVQWDDFRHGPGKSWKEVPWQAFKHCMPYDQLVEYFGKEIAEKIPLNETEKSDKAYDKTTRSLIKTAEIWEIWDKEDTRVLFICEQYKSQPLKETPDPLHLKGFFPAPEPIYAIEDTTSLIPQPPYQKYEQQATELNRVSQRIDKIVNALKIRGAYASHLTEIVQILEATDQQMIPIANASEIAAMGGLDKAIWIMPIEKLAAVLKELYAARQATLQTIYEITGLGDIMRGVSNPHETLGAQQLKSQWGTMRLQRLQREVQRFIRDLMRTMSDIICEHFQMETLQAMTGVKLPTAEDKQKLQMTAQQAQTTGQQIDPDTQAQGEKVLAQPTWDDVMQLLRSDEMRCFHIGIETDSTIAETLTRDAQGMQEAITAVVNLFNGLGPAIQEGALSVEVAKEIGLAMARNARMGDAVEEAIEQMKQPPPPQPEPPPPDHSVEVAQIKAKSDAELTQFKEQTKLQQQAAEQQHAQQLASLQGQVDSAGTEHDSRAKQVDAAAKARIAEIQEQSKQAIEQLKAQNAAAIAEADRKAEAAKAEMVATINAESKKETALIQAAVAMLTAQIAEAGAAKDREAKAASDDAKNENDKAKIENDKSTAEAASSGNDELKTHMKSMLDALVKMQKPRKIKLEMDPKGNVTGATAAHED